MKDHLASMDERGGWNNFGEVNEKKRNRYIQDIKEFEESYVSPKEQQDFFDRVKVHFNSDYQVEVKPQR